MKFIGRFSYFLSPDHFILHFESVAAPSGGCEGGIFPQLFFLPPVFPQSTLTIAKFLFVSPFQSIMGKIFAPLPDFPHKKILALPLCWIGTHISVSACIKLEHATV